MTTVRLLRGRAYRLVRAAGEMLGALLVITCVSDSLPAQGPPVHRHHAGAMPPGAIGSQRLGRGGPLSGYFQPVAILGPEGARVSVAGDGHFLPSESTPLTVGMLVAAVYPLRVTNIPNQPGMEVFPTVEVIDRLYPPPGEAARFPIPIELSPEELEMALEGKFVTRVIYVEDPQRAVPHVETPGRQHWFEALAGEDPLEVADRLGRPVAILRIGGRFPQLDGVSDRFLRASPPLLRMESASSRSPTEDRDHVQVSVQRHQCRTDWPIRERRRAHQLAHHGWEIRPRQDTNLFMKCWPTAVCK